jgi:hypothetical protein
MKRTILLNFLLCFLCRFVSAQEIPTEMMAENLTFVDKADENLIYIKLFSTLKKYGQDVSKLENSEVSIIWAFPSGDKALLTPVTGIGDVNFIKVESLYQVKEDYRSSDLLKNVLAAGNKKNWLFTYNQILDGEILNVTSYVAWVEVLDMDVLIKQVQLHNKYDVNGLKIIDENIVNYLD